MAGTIVHLIVAQKLLNRLKENSWCYSFGRYRIKEELFLAGNICPDGVMARKNYERNMKLHTHFRDGIPDGTFEIPENIRLFESRMKAFWQQHQSEEKKDTGLYLGYITHMMTDESFILEQRPDFFKQIARIGLTQKDKETFLIFNRETDNVDFALLRQHKEILEKIKNALERVEPYEIKGMITKEELTRSREWILQHFFYTAHEQKETVFLSYDKTVAFVECVVERIWRRLFEEQYIYRIGNSSYLSG